MEKLFEKKLSKIIEYGMYLLAFVLPWQTRWIIKPGMINNGYSEYLTISLYVVDVLVVLLIIFWAVYKFNKGIKDNKINIFWWLVAGLELAIFISIFFACDKGLAIFYYLRFLLAIGFLWLVASVSYNEAKFILSLLAGIFIQACLAIWQFLTQDSFSCKWLGLTGHWAGNLGASVVEAGGERWLRAYGGMDHPNIFGGVMAVGIILAILFELGFFGKKNSVKLSSLLKIFNLVFFVALFFSFSRNAWLGLVFGLVGLLVLSLPGKKLINQKIILEYLVCFFILLFVLLSQFGGLAGIRISGEGRIENQSINERVASNKEATEIIKDNFFFGLGIGNYILEQKNRDTMNRSSWEYQPAHNTYFLIWSEIGIIGLLFFISIIAFLIWALFFQSSQEFFIVLILIPTAMFLFDHWWWSLHFGVIFMVLIGGIVFRKIKMIEQNKKTE